jgi:NAD(P)-dependent dehydrogenase (short-subunit alcohol dehydrogenase family)
MFRFAGQNAVVAGASSGIGRAIALELCARGASVWLVARRRDALEQVAAEGERAGGRAWPWPLDLCNDDQVESFAARVAPQGVDILVHSAGTHALGAIAETPVAQLDAHYRANLRAPYLLTHLLLGTLLARQGQVVFVNSSIVRAARASSSHFAVTQHALKALADTLREEVNPRGMRVLSIYPGRTATPRQAAIHAQAGQPYLPERLMQPSDVARAVAQALAADRTAELTDIHLRPMQKP